MSIIVTTPYMDEAERFDRIIMMNEGSILKTGKPADIKNESGLKIVQINSKNVKEGYKLLKNLTDLNLQLFGDRVDAVLKDNNSKEEIENVLKKNNIEDFTLNSKEVTLENVFIDLLQSGNEVKSQKIEV
jgi:ABC-2 type transport system ATP-binding protein